jgi:dGTPase
VRAWRDEKGAKLDSVQRKAIDGLLEMMAKGNLQRKMNGIIGDLIQTASLAPHENFMTCQTRRHAYALVRQPEAEARIGLHKALCRDLVYGSSALQQIEFKGEHILKQLAQTLFDNYLETSARPAVLTPDEVHRAVIGTGKSAEKARLLCDHLSGMTDAYALRSYKRLLDPNYGSISELI